MSFDSRVVASQQSSPRRIKLSLQQQEQIKELFHLFDSDGGGSIDRDELETGLVALGFQSADKVGKELQQSVSFLLHSVGAAESDGLSLEQFTALMMGEILGQDPEKEIESLFCVLSTYAGEHQDMITLSKLQRACQDYGVKLSSEELELIMTAVASSRDGTVSLQAYSELMRRSAWF